MKEPIPEWQHRINKEIKERTGVLYLGDCGLKEIPQQVFEMEWLTELIMSKSEQDEDGKWKLNYGRKINSNFLTKLPQEIQKLQKLQRLIISGRLGKRWKINNLDALSTLNNLEELNVSFNQISEIKRLPSSLSSVDLSYNQISEKKGFDDLSGQVKLNLFANPIKGFPHSLIGNSSYEVSFMSHFLHWTSEIEKGYEENSFNKILVLGNGNVGKSSVIEAIKNETCIENKSSTHGVVIEQWKADEQNYVFWDFGGQEIYHNTHRMFYHGQNIVLIVFDPHTESSPTGKMRVADSEVTANMSIQYWIDQAKRYSPSSPIILVQNKKDKFPHRNKKIAQLAAREGYEFVHLSARDSACDGYSLLRFFIKHKAQSLYEYKMKVPLSWANVRNHYINELKKIQNKTKYISQSSFAQTAEEFGVSKTALPSLITFLHNGGFIYSNNQFLVDKIIIDQRWALDAIYCTLKRDGRFYHHMRSYGKGFCHRWHIDDALKEYSFEGKAIVLNFMKSCGICVELRTKEEMEYIFPEFLLDQIPPAIELILIQHPDVSEIFFQCEYLPRYLLQQIIVEYANKTSKDHLWKNGIFLNKGTHFLYLEADYANERILIKSNYTKYEAWQSQILKNLVNLNQSDSKWIKVKEAGEYENFNLELDNIETNHKIMPDEVGDPIFNIAISYAREDGQDDSEYGFNPLQSLLDNLNVLEQNNQIRIFSDRNILENDWDSNIVNEFENADLIIVLNSAYYNKNDKKYIWKREMPIIERKLEEKDKLSVLRINVADCMMTDTVKGINDFKTGFIPQTGQERQQFFKKIIENIIVEKAMKN